MWQLTKESTHASCRWPPGMRKPRGFACCPMIKMQLVAVFIPRGKLPVGAGSVGDCDRVWGNCRPCTSPRVSTLASCQSTICCLSGFHDHMLSVHFGYLLSSWITPPPPLPLLLLPHRSLTRALDSEQNWSVEAQAQNLWTQHSWQYHASCPARRSLWQE